MKSKLIYLLGALLFVTACKKNEATLEVDDTPYNPPVITPYTPDNSFKIVAYMPSYKDPATIGDHKYKMITHLFYAFLSPAATADGSLQALGQPTRFETLKQKAKINNVKFGISVGPGTGITEDTFLNIAKSATARANFVKNIAAFARNNELAGVDIDWEYPRSNNGGSEYFNLLMKELSYELHKIGKFLSAAVTPAVYQSTNREAILVETYQYVDFFNIMQYDGANYDSAEPLNHASYKMSVESLDSWFNRNLPKNKAIVGIPLYGRSSTGVLKSYRDIEASGADINLNLATIEGINYGYNGVLLVKQKAQLAKDRANGIMFWEFSHDSNNNNSLIKSANDQLGRTY